jgi:uncharacterized membrane protein YphA (DoxX/SURF4 family)
MYSKTLIVTTEIIIVLIASLLIYTGISKLIDYTTFREQIAMSPLLKSVSGLIAGLLPWTEFLIAILVLIPRWRIKGLYAFTTLMIAFIIYITAIILTNDQLPCSCGGVLEELSWSQHIVFNSIFILLGITAIIIESKLKRLKEELNNVSIKCSQE